MAYRDGGWVVLILVLLTAALGLVWLCLDQVIYNDINDLAQSSTQASGTPDTVSGMPTPPRGATPSHPGPDTGQGGPTGSAANFQASTPARVDAPLCLPLAQNNAPATAASHPRRHVKHRSTVCPTTSKTSTPSRSSTF